MELQPTRRLRTRRSVLREVLRWLLRGGVAAELTICQAVPSVSGALRAAGPKLH
jgi:hypothetical protein